MVLLFVSELKVDDSWCGYAFFDALDENSWKK